MVAADFSCERNNNRGRIMFKRSEESAAFFGGKRKESAVFAKQCIGFAMFCGELCGGNTQLEGN